MKNNYEINKIYRDDFGRVSGIFAVDKPEGKRSHDVVYDYRRKLETREVGHAGTLDPFASGLLIILVGKATKLFEKFLMLDKEYIADVAFEFKTDTLEPEVEISEALDNVEDINISDGELKEVLNSFKPEYEQYVPIFSSVKVQGNKLRELARNHDRYTFIDKEQEKYIQFWQGNEVKKEIPLPSKLVKIYEVELLELNKKSLKDYDKPFNEKLISQLNNRNIDSFFVAKIRVRCSKGTYIRKLAEDIGAKFQLPAMLIGLRRTKIGDIIIG